MYLTMEKNKVFWGNCCLGEITMDSITQEWVFMTERTPEHYHVLERGFGFNTQLIGYLNSRGVRTIRLLYRGKTGNYMFVTTIERIFEKGKHFQADGYEPQLIMPEKEFERR